MNQFLLRPVETKDFADIAQIYRHHVLHSAATFEVDPPDSETMATRHADIAKLGLPYLVAEWQGKVVAYAYANAYRPRPAYRFTIEDSIYVDPDHVGKGCGRELLGELLGICANGPWQQVIAVIGDSANQRSVRLHERFGFRHVGTLQAVGFKFDQWVDTVLMQKALHPQSPC